MLDFLMFLVKKEWDLDEIRGKNGYRVFYQVKVIMYDRMIMYLMNYGMFQFRNLEMVNIQYYYFFVYGRNCLFVIIVLFVKFRYSFRNFFNIAC